MRTHASKETLALADTLHLAFYNHKQNCHAVPGWWHAETVEEYICDYVKPLNLVNCYIEIENEYTSKPLKKNSILCPLYELLDKLKLMVPDSIVLFQLNVHFSVCLSSYTSVAPFLLLRTAAMALSLLESFKVVRGAGESKHVTKTM